MYIENIVIGTPLVSLDILLGSEQYPQYDYMEVTVIDTERYLPKLLVNHGFISSVSECKRNRKDLILTLDKTDCIEVEFKKAKKKVFIVIGE